MGMGHVPQDPVHPEGEGADVQGRQRRGTPPDRAVAQGARRPSLAAKARGRFGEQEAARWYQRRGYSVIARNWRCSAGEVDLILSIPGSAGVTTVVFCEVKARASSEFGGPWAAVNWDKQRRLRRLAAIWLGGDRSQHVMAGAQIDIRFDVVAVTGARVEVIEAAF